MDNKDGNILDVSLEYGQGYAEQNIGSNVQEEINKNYDYTDLDKEIINYHIHNIIYTLNKERNIQTLKLIYKNRNDGQLKTLLDTTDSHQNDENEMEISFKDDEEIYEIIIYLRKDERLAGFSIKTNLGKIKLIGNKCNGKTIIDKNLNSHQNIIFGLGVWAGQKYGVSSIYFYYMDKRKYGIILYSGLLDLRVKLKKEPDFKKKMEEKRDSLNDQQKIILDTCQLPDVAFFSIALYIMSN